MNSENKENKIRKTERIDSLRLRKRERYTNKINRREIR